MFVNAVCGACALHQLRLYKPLVNGQYLFTMGISLQHAQSTGTITLTDADAHTPPRIDPNYLSDRRDIDMIIEGAQ
jgi:choline dehydrogenase-like flavoprotein